MKPLAMIGCVMVLGLFAGCNAQRPEQIPRYPSMPPSEVLEKLRSRSAAIKSISGQGTLRLSGADGQSVILDTAIALQPCEKLARIRAWKFGQAVFDLTVVPDGVYVVAPRDSAQREQILKAGSNASQMIHQWLALITGAIGENQVEQPGNELLLTQPRESNTTLITTIDRPTITPRTYRLLDAAGKEQFSLALSEYAEVNGIVFPRRIVAVSAEGTIRVIFNELEINSEIPATAFKPPARAEKLP